MATIIRTDGTKWKLDDLSLESLQKAVGGYIEVVSLPDGRSIMYANEEGLLHNLAVNLTACVIAEQRIVGDVVVLTEKETQEAILDGGE